MKNGWILVLVIFCSCSLFKKTTKTTAISSFDLSRQLEKQMLDLKTQQKETQIYSYWNDSVFYQYEVIKEQVDQAKAGNVKVQEKQAAKQEEKVKESEPTEVWIYSAFVLGIIAFIIIFKKVKL